MNKGFRLFIYITLLLLIALSLLYGCGNTGSKENTTPAETIQTQLPEAKPETSQTKSPETKPEQYKPGTTGTPLDMQKSDSMSSGKTTALPWENDEKFKKAQSVNGTRVLMAAYRTVLRDPLPGEEYNVHLAAQLLAGSVVKPGQIFSQNQKVGPYTKSRGFKKGPTYIGTKLKTTTGGGVCKIASTLYNVTVLSNLKVVERHAHSMPVPYVPYGQDATVSYGVRDFKFKNNTSEPVLIWAQGVDNILYIAFYGKASPPEVQWHHETLKVKKAKVIYKKNPDLQPGAEKVVHEGMNGAVVRSWVTVKRTDGTVLTKRLGTSNYSPMSQIMEKGE